MINYLLKPDVAFYHMSPLSKWEEIQKTGGLMSESGRIFVCRSDNRAMHFSIANSQIPEVAEDGNFVVLRLSQRLNSFERGEFSADFQATEVTMPFHSILHRYEIPLEQIEFVECISIDDLGLGALANQLDNNLSSSLEFKDALTTEYMLSTGLLHHLKAEPFKNGLKFSKEF